MAVPDAAVALEVALAALTTTAVVAGSVAELAPAGALTSWHVDEPGLTVT